MGVMILSNKRKMETYELIDGIRELIYRNEYKEIEEILTVLEERYSPFAPVPVEGERKIAEMMR